MNFSTLAPWPHYAPPDPPASYYRVRWTDGKRDDKGREVIHTGSSCSLEAAREQRDKMEAERTAEQVWVEVCR